MDVKVANSNDKVVRIGDKVADKGDKNATETHPKLFVM